LSLIKKTSLLLLSAAVLSATLLPQNVNADPPPVAQITWGSAQNITADSDVSTLGTLLYAYNIGETGVASTTVNGVLFSSYVFPQYPAQTTTTGSVTFTESPDYLFPLSNLGTGSGSFGDLSSEDYKTLLSSGGSAGSPTTITGTFGGLTAGNDYLIQWWSNDSALTWGNAFEETQASQVGSPSTVTLDSNLSNSSGGLGQYAIGTFTATSSFVDFQLNGSGIEFPLINAFQIRDVTSAAVPEPGQVAASLVLLAGIGGYVFLKRRKAAKATTA
jgi:hypothetical protein